MSDPGPDDPRQREIENLQAVYRSLQEKRAPARGTRDDAAGATGDGSAAPHHRARNGIFGGAGAALAVLAGKLKFLGVLASLLKFKTLATMALSIALYATQWGWRFATGFVLLILVHELGHAIAMRHEGIPAGAPVFIPFLGAVIAMRDRPRDAWVEAKVALAGPILGSLGAWATLAAGLVWRQPLLVGLGHVGVLINLFNLIPVSPLDGGRAAGAFGKVFWVIGYALGIGALVVTRSPILFLVLLVGLWTLVQRWRHPIPGYDRITHAQRLAAGALYLGLVVALSLTLPLGQAAVGASI
jgi:Zn-dependent protease